MKRESDIGVGMCECIVVCIMHRDQDSSRADVGVGVSQRQSFWPKRGRLLLVRFWLVESWDVRRDILCIYLIFGMVYIFNEASVGCVYIILWAVLGDHFLSVRVA